MEPPDFPPFVNILVVDVLLWWAVFKAVWGGVGRWEEEEVLSGVISVLGVPASCSSHQHILWIITADFQKICECAMPRQPTNYILFEWREVLWPDIYHVCPQCRLLRLHHRSLIYGWLITFNLWVLCREGERRYVWPRIDTFLQYHPSTSRGRHDTVNTLTEPQMFRIFDLLDDPVGFI